MKNSFYKYLVEKSGVSSNKGICEFYGLSKAVIVNYKKENPKKLRGATLDRIVKKLSHKHGIPETHFRDQIAKILSESPNKEQKPKNEEEKVAPKKPAVIASKNGDRLIYIPNKMDVDSMAAFLATSQDLLGENPELDFKKS